MKRLFSLIIIMICIIIAIQACDTKPHKNVAPTIYDIVQKHFDIMDSTGIDFEVQDAENKRLMETLIRHKAEIFELNSPNQFENICVAKSADQKLCLVSWDTRQGGTLIEYTTMALYKTSDGAIQTKMLKAEEYDNSDTNTLMHYDTVYTVITPEGTLYLGHGAGQGSTALPWQELRALVLEKDQLIPATVFPEKESIIGVEFDLGHFKEDREIPLIEVRPKGDTIMIPVPDYKEGFAGEYETLVLSGSRYIKKK